MFQFGIITDTCFFSLANYYQTLTTIFPVTATASHSLNWGDNEQTVDACCFGIGNQVQRYTNLHTMGNLIIFYKITSNIQTRRASFSFTNYIVGDDSYQIQDTIIDPQFRRLSRDELVKKCKKNPLPVGCTATTPRHRFQAPDKHWSTFIFYLVTVTFEARSSS